MADPYYSEYSLSPVLKLKTYFLTEIRTAARISLVCHTPRHVLEVFRWFAEHEEETGLRVKYLSHTYKRNLYRLHTLTRNRKPMRFHIHVYS